MGYYAAGNRMHGAPPTGYLPIEEHGIVGDLRTVALVGTDGTVDWYCPSRFDAPSLFGALLDARKGGYFSLSSHVTTRPKQMYLPDTNILLTYSNHLGLSGEQIGASGEALGNFPQAFTHLALISAAVNLDRAPDRR
jgi:GH15 family glucan-1,4-alpha-glucosidase